MQNSLIYELFKRYSIKYTDTYLICPICKNPFVMNLVVGEALDCNACRDKQKIQLGEVFCGTAQKGKLLSSCVCAKQNQMDRSILIIYLKILLDYIDNLEYQLACKEEERNYEVTR